MWENDRSRRKMAERKRQIQKRITVSASLAAVVLVLLFVFFFHRNTGTKKMTYQKAGMDAWEQYDIGDPVKQVPQPELDVQLLTVNEYSRPGIATDGVRGVVVHYTANPGSTAQNNRDYFESLKDTGENQVSSNFIIGLDGEIIQCIPTNEIAYASNNRNNDTVSIECCHPDESGAFQEVTYQSLVELVAFLCGKFNLTMDNVIRHYDVTGKNCPKYYVENPDAWIQMKSDIAAQIDVDYGLQDVQ